MKHILIESLISTLGNVQLKLGDAVGAATAFEFRLRLIAELEPKVQFELKNLTTAPFYKADLIHMITAVIKVFQSNLNQDERKKIQNCRVPRNKLSHGSPVELMIELGIEPTGREIDPRTGKRNILSKEDLAEGIKSIERNQIFEKFTLQANEAIGILDRKILRTLHSP